MGATDAVAGNIDINAQGTVAIDGAGRVPDGVFSNGIFTSNGIFNYIDAGAEGKGGNIEIKAKELFLKEAATIDTSTFGQGDAGKILLRIDGALSLASRSNIFSSVVFGGEGNGGTIDIKAETLSLTGDSEILASLESANSNIPFGGRGNAGKIIIDVRGAFSISGSSSVLNTVDGTNPGNTTVGTKAEGQGGDIEIKAGTLSLSDDARINASTAGKGNAGNIFLQINDAISLSNSNILSSVASGAEGNGGTIDIKAGTLSLTGGSQIVAAVDGTADNGLIGGRGNSGRIVIDVRDAFSASGRNSSDNFSGVYTTVGAGAVGNGGSIDLKARTLSLDDGAGINASTSGAGNAGSISLQIDNTAQLNNSFIFSRVGSRAEGNGGTIDIKARSLSLINSASLSTSTFGQGDAGDISMQVDDSISLADSNIFSNVGNRGVGNGGTVDINAQSLSLTDGAQIQATVSGRGARATLPGGRGNGGQVRIALRGDFNARGRDSNGLPSGVFTSVGTGAVGRAGDIEIGARSISLDEGTIDAATASGDGGDIRLQASNSLKLRNGSRISTSAGNRGQRGNGGNIKIDSSLVIANFNGNNDITANAFRGSGGRIEINAQSIFGLIPRSRQELQSLLGTDTPTAQDFLNALNNSLSNDVAAISLTDPSFSGTVSFNADYIDPSRDLVELPTGLVDASTLVAAGCPSGAENRFVVTGGGGLPPAPGDKLSSDALLTDWASLPTPKTSEAETTIPEAVNTTPTPLVEANTWQFSSKGEIILTANASNTPNNFGATPTSCSGS
ncbi:MAG: hypothetical protein CLLPBCKN_002135 [Chroococcidiopsis cubana SAG 39.79]|uniref:Filamentous haemagglutinin FhaB/tRNA nuclease CdiA-like TPS domain-containing protein n=1 Tax=Chroococcidiopsis cubana SAG 39.79 TaxID=388085 RepID=A0AB37UCG4_9CYAN|nr:S-layer family protein [Chroococcidiopsis cubana]MDZ4872739.1 hypothetical protein [Chroococcidiopsis cubana SAG 39.79]PSB64555.1 hypothetical protein C7B79_09225 [Chroococcidiopsis cubana CCALA 043]RUT04886.1 hypothetical protein DSM107010_56830 [Chroococcidiopsis cubana SAG 39.79]